MSQMNTEPPTNQPHSIKGSSLLVVDDNSMNRAMLSRYIARLSYTESDYFQQLPGKADELCNRARGDR